MDELAAALIEQDRLLEEKRL